MIKATEPHARSMAPRAERQIPFWFHLLLSIGFVAAFGYLRLVVYPDQFVPLASSLALLMCLWNRDLRLLWGMSAAFALMLAYKLFFLAAPTANNWTFAFMQLANTLVPAVVLHIVIVLMRRLHATVTQLEAANAELEASNEELAAREEEITQQNEELQTQAEELEQQTEELNAQTEELQSVNEQLVMREQTLSDLFETSAGGVAEDDAMEKLGQMVERMLSDRMCAAAVLERQGDEMVVRPLLGLDHKPCSLPRERTLASLVLERDRAAALPDRNLRPDIETPILKNGASARSLASAPFVLAGERVGVLEVYSKEEGDWSNHELRVVQWLANQCGLMLSAARLAQEREDLLVSERSARTEAERANRMKDEFVATLSHELRTPLNAVMGWASLLKRNGGENREEVMKGIDVIERNARHQSQLISELLDISRIMAGKIRLDAHAIHLPLVVENALESVRLAADAKGVKLEKHLRPIDRAVYGDPERLQQVMWNLLSNAIKFTPKGGTVQVTLARVASYIEICVIDNGQGIEPDLQPYIFERYRQADSSLTRKQGGLGLGLAIARNLVELHGGTIGVKSDGPGKGSTFTILLPVRAVTQHEVVVLPTSDAEVQPPSPQKEELRLDGTSILVVDDERDARELLTHVLKNYGAVVRTASSGAEALKMFGERQPDVLLSDIGMPDMDGYSLIRTIRERAAMDSGGCTAIALTAFARLQDRAQSIAAGFHAHISKPVDVQELVRTISKLRQSSSVSPQAN